MKALPALNPAIAAAIMFMAVAACSPSPAASGHGVASDAAVPAARSEDAGDTPFCAPFAAMAQATCTARWSCAAPAVAELSASACGCRTGTLPPPAEQERLTSLLRATPEFACCAGIPIARNGSGCE